MGKVVNVVLTDTNEEWVRQRTHRKGDFSRIINEALGSYIGEREKVYIAQCDLCGGTTAHYRGECLEHREEPLNKEQDLALKIAIGKLKRESESLEMAQVRSDEKKPRKKEKVKA